MIPAIGLMEGGYILFRMFEVLLFASSRYAGRVQQGLAVVGAVVVALLTVICLADLFAAAGTATRGLPLG